MCGSWQESVMSKDPKDFATVLDEETNQIEKEEDLNLARSGVLAPGAHRCRQKRCLTISGPRALASHPQF